MATQEQNTQNAPVTTTPGAEAPPVAPAFSRTSTTPIPLPAYTFHPTATPDVQMPDAPAEPPPDQSPAPAQTTPSAQSPAPARMGTPSKMANGQESSSRAASLHPDPGFTMPSEAPPHGEPVRRYLNTKVTGVLLEGMKKIAKEQPKEPLRVLGEYLLEQSKKLE